MSGRQHRDDEANGPSWSSERENGKEINKRAAAQKQGCAQENKKLTQTFLTEPTSLEMFPTPILKSAPIATFHRWQNLARRPQVLILRGTVGKIGRPSTLFLLLIFIRLRISNSAVTRCNESCALGLRASRG